MPIFKGAGVAIVTPMKENLEVDYDADAFNSISIKEVFDI